MQRADKLQTSIERTVLANTIRLWAAARITSNPEKICGGEQIGSKVLDPSSPYDDTVPLSPVACAQLELISYSRLLHPFRQQVVAGLESMFKAKPRDCWLTIYLALFVIAHSCSLITKRDEEFARQLGRTVSSMIVAL
jgi:hypothetical protein